MGQGPRTSITEGDESRKPDRLLTVSEAALYLGVSKSWLYGSTMPFVQIFDQPRGRRYQRIELDAYVRSRSTRSPFRSGE